MKRSMVKMLIICGLVFGLIFGAVFMKGWMTNQYFNNMPQPPTTVSATEAKKDSWALSLDAVGTVRAINGVNVTSEVPGVVEKLGFESGAEVKKGDLLVQLDDDVDRARLEELETAEATQLSGRERYTRLYEQGNASEVERDLAVSEYYQAKARTKAQRELLKQKTIRAPFDGVVGIRQVDIGQYITPGDPLVALQQLEPIYVNFSLPEQELSQIESGLKVRASLSAYPEKDFMGDITAVEPGVDADTRNFNIQASFDNDKRMMRPGMFARVTIQLPQSEDVVVVPRTAISFNPYGDSVYVIQEKKDEEGNVVTNDQGEPTLMVKRRFIKTGRTRGNIVAVTEGLEPGERVATSGLLKLRNDATVTVNNEVTPPEDPNPTPDNS
jgi:membrane fusion protein (multidrug efflux system)